mmetsp:Transcript_14568/g.35535  ORF Transcript_14568/g.35535 Transcript_14568/m.35535 type:complete len:323 (+) Transcript_14568:1-969(+)
MKPNLKINEYSFFANRLCRSLFNLLRRKTPGYCNPIWAINRIRNFYSIKIQKLLIQYEHFSTCYVKFFPKINSMTSMETKILDLVLDIKLYIKGIKIFQNLNSRLQKIGREYIKLIREADSFTRCRFIKKTFYGLVAKTFKKYDDLFVFLHNSKFLFVDLFANYFNIRKNVTIYLTSVHCKRRTSKYNNKINEFLYKTKKKCFRDLNTSIYKLNNTSSYELQFYHHNLELLKSWKILIPIIISIYYKLEVNICFSFINHYPYIMAEQYKKFYFLSKLCNSNSLLISFENINSLNIKTIRTVLYHILILLKKHKIKIISLKFN